MTTHTRRKPTPRRKPLPEPPAPELIRVAFHPNDLARLLDHLTEVDDEPVVHRLRMRMSKHLRKEAQR